MLFPEQLNTWTGAATPFEQFGIYASVVGRTLNCANAYNKAYHVMKAAAAAPNSDAPLFTKQ